jgi:hypothetical protein
LKKKAKPSDSIFRKKKTTMNIFEVSTRLPNTYQFHNGSSSPGNHSSSAATTTASGSSNSTLNSYNNSYSGLAGHTRRQPIPTTHTNTATAAAQSSYSRHPRSSSVTSPNSSSGENPIRFAHNFTDHHSHQYGGGRYGVENGGADSPVYYYTPSSPALNANRLNSNSNKYVARVVSNHAGGGTLTTSSPTQKPIMASNSTSYFTPASITNNSSTTTPPLPPNSSRSNETTASSTVGPTILPVFYTRDTPTTKANNGVFPSLTSAQVYYGGRGGGGGAESSSGTPRANLDIAPLTYRSSSAMGQSYMNNTSNNDLSSPVVKLAPVAGSSNGVSNVSSSSNSGSTTTDRLVRMYQNNLAANNYNSNFLFNGAAVGGGTVSAGNGGSNIKVKIGNYDYPLKLTSKDYSVIRSIKARNEMLKAANNGAAAAAAPNGHTTTYQAVRIEPEAASVYYDKYGGVNAVAAHQQPNSSLVMLQSKLDDQLDRQCSSIELQLNGSSQQQQQQQQQQRASFYSSNLNNGHLGASDGNVSYGGGSFSSNKKSILVNKAARQQQQRYANSSSSYHSSNVASTPKKTVTFAN